MSLLFERKIAVFAVCVVVCMFLLVLIGPLFMPKYYDSYNEVTQQNVPPTMTMMSVPKEMKDDIKMIDSYGSFTVGLSNEGKVYIWGATQLGTTGIDISEIPEEVQNDTSLPSAKRARSTPGATTSWASSDILIPRIPTTPTSCPSRTSCSTAPSMWTTSRRSPAAIRLPPS